MKPDSEFIDALARIRNVALLVGLIAAVLCGFAGYAQPNYFFPAYLVSFLFWCGLSLGCLAITLLHHLTGGAWGLAARRVLEAGHAPLPVLAVAAVPIMLGLPVLYLWARPEAVAADEILQRKAPYLNVTFFQARTVAYFVIWILTGSVINWMASGTDEKAEPRRHRRLSLVSGPGLILWGLTVTFAAIDWGMSTEPHWFSSVYGVLWMAGQAVSAMSFAILVLIGLRNYRTVSQVATAPRLHDLGNLLFAFVLIWSYLSFTQFLIIWSANLPEETPWYLHRSRGNWQWLAILLAALHFFLPFLLLLSRTVKRRSRPLAAVACLLIVMRFVDLYWQVMPAYSPLGLFLNWQVLLTFPAVGGFWLSWFAWRLPARLSLPSFELPAEEESHELARPVTS